LHQVFQIQMSYVRRHPVNGELHLVAYATTFTGSRLLTDDI